MTLFQATAPAILLLAFAANSAAQSDSAYVNREKVDAALAKGEALIDSPQVHVAGGHRDKPGKLETRNGTTILYITDGEGTFAAGAQTQRLTKGDLVVVPAGTTQAFTSVSPAISYYLAAVPVSAAGAKSEFVGPNLRVSGGYRTGPYAPENYRPAVEIHENEADLFYVIDGRATQVLGGTVIGGKQTAPGQIRGSKIDGGQTYQLGEGDVMWVPAGMPHWFPEIPEPLSYLLVKVFY